MIVLFTDFGLSGPYVGQMKAVLHRLAPGVPVVDLMADAPTHNPRAAAYLLAAYSGDPFPEGAVFLSVVDPGVGGERRPLVMETGGRWFVGPDNGLLAIAGRRLGAPECREITWRPDRLSASFHGRDLFAPVAARLALSEKVPGRPVEADACVGADWPHDLPEVVYIDHFGNAMTGLRGTTVTADAVLEVRGQRVPPGRTFSDVPVGRPFWYVNSNGLVEVAVNCGRADAVLGVRPGDVVSIR